MRRFFTGKRGFTLGELLVIFAILIIVGSVMFPFVKKASAKNKRIVCANNLRELGLASYVYAEEHEGKFPPTLKTLYDEHYLADERLVDCPATKSVGTPGAPDYIYTGGLTVRDPSMEVLARDKASNHPQGGKNVLYVNGAVAWED